MCGRRRVGTIRLYFLLYVLKKKKKKLPYADDAIKRSLVLAGGLKNKIKIKTVVRHRYVSGNRTALFGRRDKTLNSFRTCAYNTIG